MVAGSESLPVATSPPARRPLLPRHTRAGAALVVAACVFLAVGSSLSGQFAQQTVSGLASGGIYAALALALVLIYRATEVLNFAQGAMAMFSTFLAWQLLEWGLSYWPAFLLTLALSFVGGALVELVLVRPIERASHLTIVIVTLALLIGIEGGAGWIWGSQPRFMPSSFSTRPIHLGGVAFSIQDLGTIGVTLGVVVLTWLFFEFTKVGLGMRAAALRPGAARLAGVRVSRLLALGWGLAAVLGAVAGLLAAASPGVLLQPSMMDAVLIYAFAAAVLGGLESPVGAVVGGLAIGVLLNLLGSYVSFVTSELRLPVAFAVLFVVLLAKPTGLFGRPRVRKL